jgi:hypothetical protein
MSTAMRAVLLVHGEEVQHALLQVGQGFPLLIIPLELGLLVRAECNVATDQLYELRNGRYTTRGTTYPEKPMVILQGIGKDLGIDHLCENVAKPDPSQ